MSIHILPHKFTTKTNFQYKFTNKSNPNISTPKVVHKKKKKKIKIFILLFFFLFIYLFIILEMGTWFFMAETTPWSLQSKSAERSSVGKIG
jgi:hypothetical protein